MLLNFCVITSLCLCFLMIYAQNSISQSLPSKLENCYRKNFSATIPRVPYNIQVLIELIRKLEHDVANLMNMRMLTTAIFYAARLDGIEESESGVENEFVIPFSATGKQFYKFQLIAEHFLSGNDERFSYDALSEQELCILHDIISSSLNSWERGNERITCQRRTTIETDGNFSVNVNRRLRSDCPIEKGVIKTRWGTISPGHIISAFVAAFEESHVTLASLMEDIENEFNMTFASDASNNVKIDNVLVASLVADLAEVVLNQAGTSINFGSIGDWNNSIYPREYYVPEIRWDMTRAEFLGGLDALILARKIKEWTSHRSSTRFSQILDMYYSERGVGFDKSYRACERKSKLVPLFRDVDFWEQINATAILLQKSASYGRTVFTDVIESYSKKVFDYFKTFSEEESQLYDECNRGGDNINNLVIIVILDGTWKPDEVFSMISYLAELADVSYYGSELGIINGQTGEWMVNVTSDIIEIFSNLGNAKDWPGRLQLSESLNTVSRYYQNKTSPDCEAKKLRAFGHVVLVLANTARIRDDDAANARLAIRTLKGSHPDVRIIYGASEAGVAHYEEFANNDFLNDEVVASTNDILAFVKVISEKLSNTPANVVNFYCGKVEIEDYITPGVERSYEIHRDFIRRAKIGVKFKGNDYGDLTICARGSDRTQNNFCKQVTGTDEITFDVTDICSIESLCSARFFISANNTKNKCTEIDCRFPDQIRMDIVSYWSSAPRASSFAPSLLLGIVPYVLYESF